MTLSRIIGIGGMILGVMALGWMILPAVIEGRMPSGDGTALSSASPIEPRSGSRPSGLQSTFAKGE